jgi:DNA-binding NarL/FixJ family response regulator
MKRVLIVDDEQRVLSGLRRQLHARRAEWELVFLEGGEAALSELAARPADVVVSDMRMPGMDGAQLLAVVAARHPRVARLVLSGQAEIERQLIARACCHGYLTKPCPAEQLEAAVREALDVRSALDDLAWAEGARLWSSSPMDTPTTALLFRQLAGDATAEAAAAAWLDLLDAERPLAERLERLLAAAPHDVLAAGCGARPLVALTLALCLRELIAGDDDCRQAEQAAARLLAARRAPGSPLEAALRAATAALLQLPGAARPGRRAVLQYLLPIWGFPEAVIAAAARDPGPAPEAAHLIPSPRR